MSYLVALNAHIRPTSITIGNVDTLCVPMTCSGSDFQEENLFGIEGFVLNLLVFYVLIHRLESGKSFRVAELCDKKVQGTPSWLMDWHDQAAYA